MFPLDESTKLLGESLLHLNNIPGSAAQIIGNVDVTIIGRCYLVYLPTYIIM